MITVTIALLAVLLAVAVFIARIFVLLKYAKRSKRRTDESSDVTSDLNERGYGNQLKVWQEERNATSVSNYRERRRIR